MRAIERDTEKEDQKAIQSCSNNGLDRFTSFSDLKQKYLKNT